MFTNSKRQEDRTGQSGTPRVQYLQELVTQFQNASGEEVKEKIVANLANFAYDPFNYTFLRQLNVLELFLDCITEPNERLVEFGIGGICNASADSSNAAVVVQSGGLPLIIQCLSSPVRNTVNSALGALYYLCNSSTKDEILKPEVVDIMKRYASAGDARLRDYFVGMFMWLRCFFPLLTCESKLSQESTEIIFETMDRIYRAPGDCRVGYDDGFVKGERVVPPSTVGPCVRAVNI